CLSKRRSANSRRRRSPAAATHTERRPDMSGTLRIARRELASFFNSPIAYIVLGVFLVVAGYLFFFFSGLFIAGKASMRGFFGLAPVLFLFLSPAITMRLIAEERKSGTLENLMTLPVKEWEIVAGKFLAAIATVGICMLFTLPYPLSLTSLVADGN